MDISVKRILKDINDLDKNNLNSHGIYHYIYNDDIYDLKVLMIGPSDTPYEFGYYFFTLKMPKDYPFNPPKVSYCTQNGKTRFNPNLYTNGKVCLSIINTWSGPRWSSCNTISTVLLSIQALVFTSDPLHNEPGFEKEKGIRNINYNILLTYENFKTAIHKMIVNPPMTFEYFNSITIKHFIENYEKIMEKVESNMDKNEKSYFLNFYNMSDKLNYIGLKKNLSDLHTNIIELN
jgi:ubiquitin-conjugating enzyme E2 Z